MNGATCVRPPSTYHRALAVGRRRVQNQSYVLIRTGVAIAAALPHAIVARRIEQTRIAHVEGLLHEVLAVHHVHCGGGTSAHVLMSLLCCAEAKSMQGFRMRTQMVVVVVVVGEDAFIGHIWNWVDSF